MRLFALDKQRTKLNDDKVDANEHREQQHLARHRKREILSSRMPMFEDDAMGSDEPNGCRIMAVHFDFFLTLAAVVDQLMRNLTGGSWAVLWSVRR